MADKSFQVDWLVKEIKKYIRKKPQRSKLSTILTTILFENNLVNIYNANPSMINDFYDDNPDSDTFNTTRFDRATTVLLVESRALFGPNGS